MAYSNPLQYEQETQDSTTVRWVMLFIFLSLLAHALLILVLLFLAQHIPAPKLEEPQNAPTVSLSMIAPPPQPKHLFMPTPDQKNAVHKETLVESDHDTKVASQSKTSRKDDTIMPDVVSKDNHASSLDSSPSAPPTKTQDTTTTPPAPKADQAKPTPPQPQQQPPQPLKTDAKTPPPKPATQPPPPNPPPPTQAPPKTAPPPAVDANGLPVLPMLNAPTLAPQASPNAQQQQVAMPPPAMPIVPANVQGRAGMSGQPSPEAMKTELGAYKALFYQAVGSRWYNKVGQQMQLIGVGSVRVQYTIYPDGSITTKVLDPGGSSMQILLSLSITSIREVSPFRPFPPSMLKQYPNGYTDDFSFSIY